MITFNTDGMVAQQFPFPAPIMDYIFKNLQPQHLVKLYQCCKFFYAKYRQNIIQNLYIIDDRDKKEMFHPNKTIAHVSNPSLETVLNPSLEKLIDFWISDSFTYNAPSNLPIPSFSHCTIKKLEACNFLLWEEYEVLTKAGTIKELKVGQIYDDDYMVSVEKLIAQVPNATSIKITESVITSTTCESLASLDHKAKISNFVLNNINNPNNFNLDLIFEFLNKYGDADCKAHFDFQLFMTLDRREELKQMGIEYTNIVAEKLQAKKKELALEESTLMPE